jgi:hypothetical protein
MIEGVAEARFRKARTGHHRPVADIVDSSHVSCVFVWFVISVRSPIPDAFRTVCFSCFFITSSHHIVQVRRGWFERLRVASALVSANRGNDIADDDVPGRKLEDARLAETRRRAPKRRSKP